MQELFTNLFNLAGLAWWVEVTTETPKCTYYFGPFFRHTSAEKAKAGYIEDLEREGAQGMRVSIKRCKPGKLTIGDDLGENSQGVRAALSGQF